jgi:hypothetical protein
MMGSVWNWLWRDKSPGEIAGLIISIVIGLCGIAGILWKLFQRLVGGPGTSNGRKKALRNVLLMLAENQPPHPDLEVQWHADRCVGDRATYFITTKD